MLADRQTEQISREELNILQLERLRKIVAWAYEKSNFYRQSFRKCGVVPEDIQSLTDIQKLPLLSREEFSQVGAFEFLTLPLSGVVRINHNANGIDNFCTKDDIRNNVEMMIRCLAAADVLRGSLVGIPGDLSDGKFLDVLYALESIGATVIPFGGDENRWLDFTENFGTDTLIAAPQSVKRLNFLLQAKGKDINDCTLTKIFCVDSDNITNTLRQDIGLKTSVKIFNLFTPCGMINGGIFCQCSAESRYHIQEDFFLIELLKSDGDKIVADDCEGELTVTSLTAQALPLIRLRTGQFVRRINEKCTCGRTFTQIAPF